MLNDDIKSDHAPILVQVGEPHITTKIVYKDWNHMDWDLCQSESAEVVQNIIDHWDNQEVEVDEMAHQLSLALTSLANRLVPIKVICKHSKPWVNEVVAQLKIQRYAKLSWRKRRSPKNCLSSRNG